MAAPIIRDLPRSGRKIPRKCSKPAEPRSQYSASTSPHPGAAEHTTGATHPAPRTAGLSAMRAGARRTVAASPASAERTAAKNRIYRGFYNMSVLVRSATHLVASAATVKPLIDIGFSVAWGGIDGAFNIIYIRSKVPDLPLCLPPRLSANNIVNYHARATVAAA